MPEERIQHSAVINPYALAELIIGRPIAWKEIPDRREVLEQILQTPYEELFDPQFDSPLYLGLRLNEDLELVPDGVSVLDTGPDDRQNDLEQAPEAITRLGDLRTIFDVDDVADIAVERADTAQPTTIELTLKRPREARRQRLATVLSREVLMAVVPGVNGAGGNAANFTPPNAIWGDSGRFFNEAAEYFDPIQGAVANCYLIAAMASVAWAKPYMIQHLTRATGTTQQQFTNMIRFRDIDNGNAVREVEVTDSIPLTTSGQSPIYCRSSEVGEIWPGVYEKAFAKWKTGHAGDQPNIPATAWGDCVRAAAELTGLSREYNSTTNFTAQQLWDKVRANSLGRKTFNPMVAATYSSGQATEKKIVYADANLVASHAYSVLGWDYRDGQRYIILRNPWGSTEATLNALTGTSLLFDVSWWRPIVLTDPDGVFALRDDTFKTYFSLLGVVK